MKVVQINAVYAFSSTGRIAMEIHNALRERGDESWVFCTNHSDVSLNIGILGNRIDYKIHAFMSRLMGLQGYFSVLSTKRFIKRLSKIKPDVVHLHNLHGNFINLPLLLKYLAVNDVVTVVTLHDCWFFTGHCCHYTEDECDKWLSECSNCPALHKYNNSWFFDRSRKVYADKKQLLGAIPRLVVIGNSEWTTAQARRSFLSGAKIIARVYNWINLDVFYPRSREKGDEFVILGVAQGWSEKKGLSIFTQIAEHFFDCRVILVGKIDADMKLPSNISIVGEISSTEELAEYYSNANVFVNPSIQETFGKVSAEALACGTPIVVNNATANPELVGQGCGYIASNNNIKSYFKAIEYIRCRSKAYYLKKCVDFARTNFEMKSNISSYFYLYESTQW